MRLLLQFLFGFWLLSSLLLLLIFGLTSYATLAHGWQQPNYAVPDFVRLPLPTPAQYAQLRLLLAGAVALGLFGFGAACLWRRAKDAPASTTIARFGGRAARYLFTRWPAKLPLITTLVLLAAVISWRAAYLTQVPIDTNSAGSSPSLDELASYDYFARPGPAVAASYYQLPNNHVAHNLLAAGLGLLLPLPPATPSALLIRLPAILFGLLGLLLSFTLLRRYAGLLPAILATGGFYLLPVAISYAVMGRGYALTLTCAVGGTWAALHMLSPVEGRGRSLAWAGFVMASVVGILAVPSHLYTVLAQGLVLLVWLGQPGPARNAQLRLLVTAAGLGVALLLLVYAPVLLLSGGGALLDNMYVQPRPAAWFWPALGPALQTTAAELFGQGSISSGLYVFLLVGFPVVWRRGRFRILVPTYRLGWLAYAQAAAPIPLMMLQRQLAPARTLLPATFFTIVAACLLLQVFWPMLRRRWPTNTPFTAWLRPRAYGWQLVLATSALLLLGSYRFSRVREVLAGKAREGAQLQLAYQWLQTHLKASATRNAAVVVSLRSVAIAWHHRALVTGQPALPLVVAEYPENLPSAKPFRNTYYVVGHTDATRPDSPWLPFTQGLRLRYQDPVLSIYSAGPARQ